MISSPSASSSFSVNCGPNKLQTQEEQTEPKLHRSSVQGLGSLSSFHCSGTDNSRNSPELKNKLAKQSSWINSACLVPEEVTIRQEQVLVKEEAQKGGREEEEESPLAKIKMEEIHSKVTQDVTGEAKDETHITDPQNVQHGNRQQHTLLALLKTCATSKDLHRGSRIHAAIVKAGLLEKNTFLGSSLVSMYAKCGFLTKAQEVFDTMAVRDVISWNALIAGYAQHGHGQQAIQLFERMQLDGLLPNAVTYVCMSKACGSIGAAEKGREIHAEIVKKGLLRNSIILGNALVDMYAKCNLLEKAQEVFDILPARDAISWSVLIGGYAQYGHGEQALKCFEQMQLEGLSPDAITFVSILKACGRTGAVGKGQQIHDEIVRRGFLEKDTIVGNALVDMYAKCGLLGKAQEVFDKLLVLNVVSWSALIAGYAQQGYGEQALKCYEHMQLKGVSPDAATFACILKICGTLGTPDKGKEIHAEIIRGGLLTKDIVVGTALVDMYSKCGLLAEAQQVFDELPVRNVISWTALMAGYVQHGHGEKALKCFESMQHEDLSPNAITYVCVLQACGRIGAVKRGKEIHAEIVRKELLETDVAVGTALVDMYAKCGLLAKAQGVFDELPRQDVVTWSVLMAGYALLGKVEHVFQVFDKMIRKGLKPDMITFTIVLNACGHTGLLDKGQMYFESMRLTYGVSATLEHYTCMVDLFARAGHLSKALAVIKNMPFSADLRVWLTMLGACRKWGNVKLGRLAFEHAVQLGKREAAVYICMNNIYAAAGKQQEADKIESMRVKNQAWKKSEHCWWTDVTGNVHLISAGDRKHSERERINAKLESLALKMSQEGNSHRASWNILNGEKNNALCEHSEMLGIAYALINTSKGTPIHLIKNSQICDDCHSATSLISRTEKCKIFVRDAERFHVFENGKCTCGDCR